jgi:N-methylhydantoinase A
MPDSGSPRTLRIASDVGGTFTDIVTFDAATGVSSFGKTLTTPSSIVEGILTGVGKTDAALDRAGLFLHGTTVAINTILERNGARTALVTTRGFRDIYEIGRINRPEAYNLFFTKHDPLIPRSLRYELSERTTAQGEILLPLDTDELARLVQELQAHAIEAVAILFLHSYVNPEHELQAKRYIETNCPGMFVSASHEISQEYREFERTSTIAANAYIGPRVRTYLAELDERLGREKFDGTFHVVQSNGGLFDAATAQRECIRMLESGPAAGVIGTKAVCARLGIQNAIAFDMGGTTAKAGVVYKGDVVMAGNILIGGYARGLPIQIPLIDIQEVGTGGGSIARVAAGGALRVGPQSAGASPGPACYGLGGDQPTVTDANLLLGRLASDNFLGGEMRLDVERARAAMSECVAKPLGLDVAEAASGIIQIAATTMSHVVTRVTTERGLDAGNFTMVAYGGAGPLHACLVARELKMPTVIIPPAPGHFSAFGMLVADLRRDFVHTWFKPVDRVDLAEMESLYLDMERAGRESIAEAAKGRHIECRRGADMRYVGQEHSVTVELPHEIWRNNARDLIKKRFDDVHAQRYGFSSAHAPAEIVSLHASVIGILEKPEIARTPAKPGTPLKPSWRAVYFPEAKRFLETAVHQRDALPRGAKVAGPALIEEHASTTVVFPGDQLEVGEFGDLIITIARS